MFTVFDLDDIIFDISSNCRNITDDVYYDAKQILKSYSFETLEDVYKDLFEYISNINKNFVCSSGDIHEEIEHGDYDYYLIYTLISSTPMIYMRPSHDNAFPNKLMIFGGWYIAIISDDKKTMIVRPSDISLLVTHDIATDIDIFKNYLMQSDRESLVEESEWE